MGRTKKTGQVRIPGLYFSESTLKELDAYLKKECRKQRGTTIEAAVLEYIRKDIQTTAKRLDIELKVIDVTNYIIDRLDKSLITGDNEYCVLKIEGDPILDFYLKVEPIFEETTEGTILRNIIGIDYKIMSNIEGCHMDCKIYRVLNALI